MNGKMLERWPRNLLFVVNYSRVTLPLKAEFVNGKIFFILYY